MTQDTSPETWFDERYRCSATAKRSGERCRVPAIRGASVCWKHGGAAPQVREAARRRLERIRLEGEVGALMDELGLEAEHPIEVLLDAVHQAHSMASLLRQLVAGLSATPGATAGGEPAPGSGPRSALYGPDHLGDARAHALVELHARWVELAARTSKLALDAGLDERRVRMQEAEVTELVDIMGGVIRDVIDALGQAGVDSKLLATIEKQRLPEIWRARLAPAIEAESSERA